MRRRQKSRHDRQIRKNSTWRFKIPTASLNSSTKRLPLSRFAFSSSLPFRRRQSSTEAVLVVPVPGKMSDSKLQEGEKDALISQLRKRITDLEQENQRLVEQLAAARSTPTFGRPPSASRRDFSAPAAAALDRRYSFSDGASLGSQVGIAASNGPVSTTTIAASAQPPAPAAAAASGTPGSTECDNW